MWEYLAMCFHERKLKEIQESLGRIERILMAIQEDFKAFVVVVNDRTNSISTALDTIKTELAAIATNPATPADIAASVTATTASLQAVSDNAKAIAAGNNPANVPPPVVVP